MAQQYSPEYIEIFRKGPFPNRVDLWAELGRYFHPIHSGMIGHLLEQVQLPLLQLGYVAGRETSLQVTERREPDIYVEQTQAASQIQAKYHLYPSAASDVLADAGIELQIDDSESDLDAILIKHLDSGQLVTIVEVISPSNKSNLQQIEQYQARRKHLIHQQVNVVEIDITRSIKRLVDDALVDSFPYYVMIHLANQTLRFIGMNWEKSLKRIALPELIVPMQLQDAYNHAYQVAGTAIHIDKETAYELENLPFPTLLPPEILKSAIRAVDTWHTELKRLRD